MSTKEETFSVNLDEAMIRHKELDARWEAVNAGIAPDDAALEEANRERLAIAEAYRQIYLSLTRDWPDDLRTGIAYAIAWAPYLEGLVVDPKICPYCGQPADQLDHDEEGLHQSFSACRRTDLWIHWHCIYRVGIDRTTGQPVKASYLTDTSNLETDERGRVVYQTRTHEGRLYPVYHADDAVRPERPETAGARQ